jgi:hypothetical protein
MDTNQHLITIEVLATLEEMHRSGVGVHGCFAAIGDSLGDALPRILLELRVCGVQALYDVNRGDLHFRAT